MSEVIEILNAMNEKIEIGGRTYPVIRKTSAGVYILSGNVQMIPQTSGRWLEITPENPEGRYVDAKLVKF